MNQDETQEIHLNGRLLTDGDINQLTHLAFDAAEKIMSEIDPTICNRITYCTLAMAISHMLIRQTREPEELNDFHRHSYATVMELLSMAEVDLSTITRLTESEPDSL